MSFSSKDLEDIQRVAGLLNLTVDELLQQRRRPSQVSSPGALDGTFASLVVDSGSPYVSPPHDAIHHQHSSPVEWPLDSHSTQYSGSVGLDHADMKKPQTQTFGAAHDTSTHVTTQDRGNEKVILLNPQTSWFDCDASLWDFNNSVAEDLPMDNPRTEAVDDGDLSFVPITPMQVDSELGSDCTARDECEEVEMDDVSMDWAIVPSSPGSLSSFQTPASPSNGSVDRRYHLIAPKGARSGSYSISESSSHRVRKKRSPYQGAKKTDTNLTRQVHACVRCRMQRNRVSVCFLLFLDSTAYSCSVCS